MSSTLRYGLVALAISAVVECPLARADNAQPIAKPGTIEARLGLEVGLNEDDAKDPISLSPDLRYGITGALDVGVIHSSEAVTGFEGFQNSASLCIAGTLHCDQGVYHNLGVEGRYALVNKRPWWLVSSAAVLANELDPLRLALKLGAAMQWNIGRLRAGLEPNVHVPVTERETSFDLLNIPGNVSYGISELRVGIQAGAFSTLDDQIFNKRQFPISLGLQSQPSRNIALAIGFALPAFGGGKDVPQTGFELQTLWASLTFTTPSLTRATHR